MKLLGEFILALLISCLFMYCVDRASFVKEMKQVKKDVQEITKD